MKYKAHIIKLDRAIIFQPIFVEDNFYYKIMRHFGNNPSQILNMSVYMTGNAELGDDHIFLGTTGIINRKSKNLKYVHSIKDFESNDDRDLYYDRIIKVIEKSIETINSKQ